MQDIELFREWQAADRAACAAEKAVLADSLRPAEAMGTSPAVYHVEKARRRRAMANQLLQLALAAMQPRAARPAAVLRVPATADQETDS